MNVCIQRGLCRGLSFLSALESDSVKYLGWFSIPDDDIARPEIDIYNDKGYTIVNINNGIVRH